MSNRKIIYIDDAINALNKSFDRETLLNHFVRKVAIDAIKQLPSAQPERKKGKWINKKPRWIGSLSMTVQDAYECSNCGEAGVNWWKYCIYCGASMEIEEWRKPIIERWRIDETN